jgi:hypothetical protein
MDAMIRVLRTIIKPALTNRPLSGPLSVVDFGSYDVNGTYRGLFDHPGFTYTGVDLEEGPNVDLVMSSPSQVPLPDGSVDLVVSGQMLEHAPRFWEIFGEMARVLAPGGLMIPIAPSQGPEHRYPVDCYRFLPDSFSLLAADHQLTVRHLEVNDYGPWYDLVGVFHAPGSVALDHHMPGHVESGDVLHDWVPSQARWAPSQQWDAEPGDLNPGPGVHYLQRIQKLHRTLKPRGYLEIGVHAGKSFRLAACPAIGIDPEPTVELPLPSQSKLFEMTSDEYFSNHHDPNFPVDLAFLDGEHLFEFALRDFIHLEEVSNPKTVIVIDDVFPGNPRHASRNRHTTFWTGDVWRLGLLLRERRPDLRIRRLGTSPAGMLRVDRLNPSSRLLRDNYNGLVAHYRARDYAEF